MGKSVNCLHLLSLNFLLLFSNYSFAKEGMWLPNLLGHVNEAEMKDLGMKISADDIYSINHTSLKDAVVQFGGGCTGELISSQSLLLTNHHCGFSQIQTLSTLEKNYIKDGYWAKSFEEELPCPGLTATFIIEIRNVSEQILPFISDTMSEMKRQSVIKLITDNLEKAAISGTHYKAFTKSFYQGNEFYLFITEVFTDIRFVGVAPKAIGNFGSDTDNWMWPRHTGDFSLFRIYAGKDNHPADYSKENKPFSPRYFLPINISGIKEGDFAMIMGFPGKTNEYLPAEGLEMVYSQTNADKVSIREQRLKIWKEAMGTNDTIQLNYSAKYRTLANYYKKWSLENQNLRKHESILKRKGFDKQFLEWTLADSMRRAEFGNLLNDFSEIYSKGKVFGHALDYTSESLMGIELLNYVLSFKKLIELRRNIHADEKEVEVQLEKTKKMANGFFKSYSKSTDKKVCFSMLKLSDENMSDSLRPDILVRIKNDFSGDFMKYTEELYSKTIFLKQEKLLSMLNNFGSVEIKKLTKDPAWKLAINIQDFQKEKIQPSYNAFVQGSAKLLRKYMEGILQMDTVKQFYPDANSTLRVTYGSIQGMNPRDGVIYNWQTNLDGLIEKGNLNDDDFQVPEKLKELYATRNFGQYESNGSVPLAFLTSTQTTGGNSGSPVLNDKGELIGTSFDRASEGVMSDYVFDEKLTRTISLDIRFTLFIIEKLGGADRLIQEMKIIKDK